MKNIILGLILLANFSLACKGQDKDTNKKENKSQKTIFYTSKCDGNYSTGENLFENDKKWTLTKADVDKIMSLSTEITENELHFTYPVTPCNINIHGYQYNGKKYDLQINGGSYISLFDGKKTIILGCNSSECSKYFLKPKENTEDENGDDRIEANNSDLKKYNIDINKNKTLDLLTVEKGNSDITLNAIIDNKSVLIKKVICDSLSIETNVKNGQSFNLIIGYSDQNAKLFRKVVIPVFYRNNDFQLEKIFISTLGISAKTGNEEWFNKEKDHKTSLENFDLDKILE